jgi:hypothetical protein
MLGTLFRYVGAALPRRNYLGNLRLFRSVYSRVDAVIKFLRNFRQFSQQPML